MGRGKRKFDAPLQPNGKPNYLPRSKNWVSVQNSPIDVTSSNLSNVKYWSAPATGGTGTVWFPTWEEQALPNPAPGLSLGEAEAIGEYHIGGTFQDVYFNTGAIDIVKDNPVEAVVREVLGLYPDDELLGISYRTKDGEVKVRPWNGDE